MCFFLKGTTVKAANLPNTATGFYDWLVSNGKNTTDIYYDNNSDEIRFVTRGRQATSGIRYSVEGFQVRVPLGNKILWTIFPIGKKGLRQVSLQERKDAGSVNNYIYILYALPVKTSLITTLKNEFVNTGKITQADLDKFDLASVRLDGAFVRIVNGTKEGGLNSDGTPYGKVYLTEGVTSGSPYYMHSTAIKFKNISRYTSHDTKRPHNAYNGIRGAAPWASQAHIDIRNRFNLRVNFLANDIGVSRVRLYDSNGNAKTDIETGKTYTARFDVTHYVGESNIGTGGSSNPLAKVNYTIKNEYGSTLTSGNASATSILRPNGRVTTSHTKTFTVTGSKITICGTIDGVYASHSYNITNSNDKKCETFTRAYNNYYAKSFSASPGRVIVSGSGSLERIKFTFAIGHKGAPTRSITKNPIVRITNTSTGARIWNGTVPMGFGNEVRKQIIVNTTIRSGINSYKVEINPDRTETETSPSGGNAYSDNIQTTSVSSFNTNYGINDVYVRTKWTKDTGKNDYPSKGSGWMRVSNGGSVKIKAGYGFETAVTTSYATDNIPPNITSTSDYETVKMELPHQSNATHTMDLFSKSGSWNSHRSVFELRRRSPLGVLERKIYTPLNAQPGQYRISISGNKSVTIRYKEKEIYTIEVPIVIGDEDYEKPGQTRTETRTRMVDVKEYDNQGDSSYFYLNIIPQDDLKSHIMR